MFNDQLQQGDGVTIALTCGFCGQLADPDHLCEQLRQVNEEKDDSDNRGPVDDVEQERALALL